MDSMVNAQETFRDLQATPALVIDLLTAERNVTRLATYAAGHNIAVRPHTKTHKSLTMATRQVRAGAIGLTAAKVGEAEALAAAAPDLLIAYPAVDEYRCRRIAALAHGGATVRVAADSTEGIDALAAAARSAGVTVGVLIDLDIGFHRTGAQSPAASLALARHVTRDRSLRLDGIFFYPGHVWSAPDRQSHDLAPIDALLTETIDLWKRSGLEARVVSGGSTPTAYQSHLLTSLTEIRPGTYIYNDMNTARAGFCSRDDCAARLVCTVVSTSVAGKAVIDAGTKTFTSDRNIPAPDSGHGHVVEYPEVTLARLSEEHGELDTTRCARPPQIGERVTVIPNHICPCVNLQDTFWLRHADGALESIRVDARGRLS
jgi:D-serine deaminase-like pyridoxal phosphate-dependent protein